MKRAHLLQALAAATIALAPAAARAQTPPQPAPAADNDEGRTRFQRGVTLFREGDYRSALVEFRRSYDLSKNYKVLYNIGQTNFELQDYAGALRAFQRYLEGGGAEIDAARRAQVEEDLKKLAARVARVEVKSNTADAEVLVDDVAAGKTPLAEPLLVSIGRRKITLQKGGATSSPRYVDLAGGDHTAVTVELAEQAAPPPPLAPVQKPADLPPPPAPAPSRTGLWVSLAITGVLAAGTAVSGALALGAHSDAQAKLDQLGVKASDVQAAHDKAQKLALVADIMGASTLVMAGVTVVLGVTSGKGDAPAAKAASIKIGPRSLSIEGRF